MKRNTMTFGERLRDRRQALGLTQEQLAKRVGMHRPSIAHLEADRYSPLLVTVERLAKALETTVPELLSDHKI